jgi:pseudouridine synthase
MVQRLQKLLASAGIASRRSSEELIARGKVTVNGVVVTELGAKADLDSDDIRVFGKPLPRQVERIYVLLNKPTGYVSTVKDPHAERTVMQLLRDVDARVYPVGRLDADSAGLLILTNDGEFTKLLTHPGHQIKKTYRAVVRGKVMRETLTKLAAGIELEDGITAPADARFIDYDSANNASIIDLTIHEGRNRQVRRMMLFFHHPVLALTRTQIGPIHLRGLPPGKWRKLHPAEVTQLKQMAESAAAERKRPMPPVKTAGPNGARVTKGRTSKPSNPVQTIPPETHAARQAAAEISRRLRQPDEDAPGKRRANQAKRGR